MPMPEFAKWLFGGVLGAAATAGGFLYQGTTPSKSQPSIEVIVSKPGSLLGATSNPTQTDYHVRVPTPLYVGSDGIVNLGAGEVKDLYLLGASRPDTLRTTSTSRLVVDGIFNASGGNVYRLRTKGDLDSLSGSPASTAPSVYNVHLSGDIGMNGGLTVNGQLGLTGKLTSTSDAGACKGCGQPAGSKSCRSCK